MKVRIDGGVVVVVVVVLGYPGIAKKLFIAIDYRYNNFPHF